MADESDNSEKLRNELENQWREIKEKSDQLSMLGADISKLGAGLSDAASLGVEAAKYGSPYADWETSIESARRLNQSLDSVTGFKQTWVLLNSGLSTSGSIATDQSNMLVSNRYIRRLPYDNQQEAFKVQQAYSQHFERSNIKEDVLDLMIFLGFEKTNGGKTTISKFKNAWELYEQKPVATDPAIGSLMSLRGAINFAVDELIRRRPERRVVKAKIKEIGQQLAFDHIEKSVFDDLENQYSHGGLQDVLSGAKKNITPREDETELMQRGTRFLKALLSVIDPKKLK